MQCKNHATGGERVHMLGKWLLREIHFQSEMEESSMLQSDLFMEWKRIPELSGIRVGVL